MESSSILSDAANGVEILSDSFNSPPTSKRKRITKELSGTKRRKQDENPVNDHLSSSRRKVSRKKISVVSNVLEKDNPQTPERKRRKTPDQSQSQSQPSSAKGDSPSGTSPVDPQKSFVRRSLRGAIRLELPTDLDEESTNLLLSSPISAPAKPLAPAKSKLSTPAKPKTSTPVKPKTSTVAKPKTSTLAKPSPVSKTSKPKSLKEIEKPSSSSLSKSHHKTPV
jgi:hypothetical protein